MPTPPLKKRIILCCDGTWQNGDNARRKVSKWDPIPNVDLASNVTRISRCFQRACSDGTSQVIYYQSGVGSRSGFIDKMLGGAFGVGVAEHVHEAYAYLCANYVDGDEIILIGYSRGAFTARSVAGLISDIGLLTREGMKHFYVVFKDMQHWKDLDYKDDSPNVPFPQKPRGVNAEHIYRERLVELGYSRVRQDKGRGNLIRVKAVGVWETVGALGIPDIAFLTRMGIQPNNHEYRFYNTSLSAKIEHAFHALALDETRGPFLPTLWERTPEDRECSDLRQVWFPGSHTDVGGGSEDQGIANIALASSINCEFIDGALDVLFEENVEHYTAPDRSKSQRTAPWRWLDDVLKHSKRRPLDWAAQTIYEADEPVRPWGLHAITSGENAFYEMIGSVTRTPGLYHRINCNTNRAECAFLEDTNERIHSSVRIRLACDGLGVEDERLWHCRALFKHWRPVLTADHFHDPVAPAADRGPETAPHDKDVEGQEKADEVQSHENGASSAIDDDGAEEPINRWVWDYTGPDESAPPVRRMVEENMGPFEKHLLHLATGKVPVFGYADAHEVGKFGSLGRRARKRMIKAAKER
ncbi:hypothetical protein GGR56DRAFT_261940 [Xylariaceae sp. FL0804]|nr:hypothetical protein GGR56DRAFT_261940 [Xylariaceae sp. FL0804]